MLHDQLIICLATVSWDFLWQRHQELMARFARANNRVLFVEPLGIRTPGWEDRKRIAARLRNRRRAGKRGVRQVMENVWAVDPLVNPFQQVTLIHQSNVRAVTRQLENAIDQIGGGTPHFWTYVATPLARNVIANIPHRLLVYDCVDALTENPKGVFAAFAESEKMLSREADVVFVTSPKLLERQLPLNPRTYFVRHGVAYEKFANDDLTEPAALAPIPHPRLLFFGSLDERVDLNLLEWLAARHAEWQIVLMGVARTDISALKKFRNVHFLGQIAHEDLPAYLHHCDIFLLPYVRNRWIEHANPVKLHECLAVGKPIFATPMPVLDEYRDVLCVAESREMYEQGIVDALREGENLTMMEKRRARARANTWDARFAEINAVLEPLLTRS